MATASQQQRNHHRKRLFRLRLQSHWIPEDRQSLERLLDHRNVHQLSPRTNVQSRESWDQYQHRWCLSSLCYWWPCSKRKCSHTRPTRSCQGLPLLRLQAALLQVLRLPPTERSEQLQVVTYSQLVVVRNERAISWIDGNQTPIHWDPDRRSHCLHRVLLVCQSERPEGLSDVIYLILFPFSSLKRHFLSKKIHFFQGAIGESGIRQKIPKNRRSPPIRKLRKGFWGFKAARGSEPSERTIE